VCTTSQVLELTNCSALEGLVGVESPFLMKLAITNCRNFVALDIAAIRLTQIDLTASSALTGFELRGESMANVQVNSSSLDNLCFAQYSGCCISCLVPF
jgi:hypothetical protein